MAEAKMAVYSAEWLSMGEAAKALGKSAKTVERLAAAGELESKLEPRAGRKPERLYSAAGLERIRAVTGQYRPHAPGTPRAIVPRPPQQLAIAGETVKGLLEAATEWRGHVGLTEKLWLSLDEAVELSGLARTDLTELCKAAFKLQAECRAQHPPGMLRVRKSGGWKIQRASLEAFAG